MKLSARRLGSLVAVAVVATVALAGCAAPTPTPTQHHSASPKPTPTPTAAAASGSRVPLGCDDLLGTATVQSLAGASPNVDQDENSAPTDIWSAAQLQYGVLSCDWDGLASSSETVPGAELQVVVAPNAKSQFEDRFAAIMADQSFIDHPVATESVAGDQSGYWCATAVDALGADAFLPVCDAEMLVSNYWVSIRIGEANALTRPQLVAGVANAMTEVASRLSAAGPAAAAWSGLSTAPPGFCAATSSTAVVRAILGDSSMAAYKVAQSDVYAWTIGLVGHLVQCAWSSSSDSLTVSLLGGGSWIFPAFAPRALGDSDIQSYSTVTVAGASSARLGCADGVCDSYLAVGSTAVEVTLSDVGATKNITELAALANAIAAS